MVYLIKIDFEEEVLVKKVYRATSQLHLEVYMLGNMKKEKWSGWNLTSKDFSSHS